MVNILREAGAATAYLFGSRARGDEHPGSDYDIAVLLKDPGDAVATFELQTELVLSLSKLLGGSVDVVMLHQAGPTLRFEAVWRGQCLFAPDEQSRIDYELKTRREFEDYAQIQSFYTQAMKERLAR